MPTRMIRDELLTSERYWACSPEARNLYISVLLSADDCARYTASNFALRTKCMAGTVSAERIEKLVAELMDADLIRIYEHDGARYLFVPRFRQTLRYVNSRYPAPPQEINDISPSAFPDVSPQEWTRIRAEVIARDGGKCIRCESTLRLAAHHLTPKSKGGKSVLENLVTLCIKCNSWARTNIDRCQEINDLAIKKQCLGNAQAMPKSSEVKRSEEKHYSFAQNFALFWQAYPKKKSKGQAEKAWKRLNPDEPLLQIMLQAIAAAKQSLDWTRDSGQYIPYPATWLNAKGWEDELQMKKQKKVAI